MTSLMEAIVPGADTEIPTDQTPAYEDDTLNESIKDSLMRDLRSITRKLVVVLIPSKRNRFEQELKNCFLFLRIHL